VNANEQTIQNLFDAIDRKDEDVFREIFAEDVYYERPKCPPMIGVEPMITFYREERPIAKGKHLIEHIVANDKAGAAWGRMQGTTKSGKDVDIIFSDVYEFDARGRICKRRGYFFDVTF
jgi:ketosteroid isomerase-like protein